MAMCRLAEGRACLLQACGAVYGQAKPYAICGSLPLVRDLQRGGFDVQMIGFGLLATYHADNEYCLLSHMQKGFRVLARVVGLLDRS